MSVTSRRGWGLAWRALRRDSRSGELNLLAAAIVTAVASMSAVGFFADRVERAMHLRASELLAADLVIHSNAPISPATEARARALGLTSTRLLDFRSVLLIGEQFQLAEVKAVSAGYPLRGVLLIAPQAFAEGAPTTAIPARGTVWLDSQLVGITGLAVGDELELGASRLRVEAVLIDEPDRGSDLFNIAPRLMMNYADVDVTGLIQPASRVNHALLLAGTSVAIERFRRELEGDLPDERHFHGIHDARPGLSVALKRAEQFLGLAALIGVLLSGAAIAISSQRYAERRLDTAAMMRCLGASQRSVVEFFLLQILILGLAASLVGCVIGYGAQTVLVLALEGLVMDSLPLPGPASIVQGLAIGLCTLAGFGLTPILRLKHVPPGRVLRRELGQTPAGTWSLYGGAVITFAGLCLWQAQDTKLAAYVLGGSAATLLLMTLCGLVLVSVLGRLRGRVGVTWRFGLANIARRPRSSIAQVTAFGLGIMVLLLLTIVRDDLLDTWRQHLPDEAPNFFLVNVSPEDVPEIATFLRGRGLTTADLSPMVRGRLVAINARAVSGDDFSEGRGRQLATREFNLSFMDRLPSHNRISAGRWWSSPPRAVHELSVETGIAQTLGIRLGDVLTFNVAGTDVRAMVTSLRSVEWDSFRVNFFVIASPGLLERSPATYISSFYLPGEDRRVLVDLVRRFPSVTVLDVDALLSKVRAIMDQAAAGVQYVFSFTLVAGIIVLVSAIQSTMDERRYETAIVRALGGTRAALVRGLVAEFVTLGSIAGLCAAVASTAIGAILASEVFELSYRGDPALWIVGTLAGALGIGLVGTLSASPALRHPPLHTLRNL